MLFQKCVRDGSLTRLVNSRQLWTAQAAHKLERDHREKTKAEAEENEKNVWIPGITTFKTEQTFGMLFQKWVRDGSLTRLLNSRQLWTARAADKLQRDHRENNDAEENKNNRWMPGIKTCKIEKKKKHIRNAFSKMCEGWQSYPSFEFTSALYCTSSRQTSNVTISRRMMQRSKPNAKYRELKRGKQNKHSVCFFKKCEEWQSYLSSEFLSALYCKSSRQIWTWPCLQDQCRGVRKMLNTGN